MGKMFLKVKLENFERVREEKIVYGVDNLRKTVVCGNLFSIVNYEPAGGTPNRKIFELRVYDGNEITTLNSTKEGFEEMFESVDFEGIKIPLVSFNNELYEMIQDNQDRYFDIDSAEILSGKSIKFKEKDFDNGLIAISREELINQRLVDDDNEDDFDGLDWSTDNWDSDEKIILSSLMIDIRKFAKILFKKNKLHKEKSEEVIKEDDKISKKENNKSIEKEINTELKEIKEAKQIKRTDESILNSFVDILMMQSMMNLFNQHTKTDDEIKLENLKNFLKNLN